ncbi:MAG: hypothetical protein EAZ90_21395, partial [Oscillatoriales cyanobacterium]
LEGVSRGALISPLKVRIWTLQESPSRSGLGSIKGLLILNSGLLLLDDSAIEIATTQAKSASAD